MGSRAALSFEPVLHSTEVRLIQNEHAVGFRKKIGDIWLSFPYKFYLDRIRK